MGWARKRIHNKHSRHLSPITDSQTVQAQTYSDTKLTVSSA